MTIHRLSTVFFMLALVAAIAWGRSISGLQVEAVNAYNAEWSEKQLLLHKAIAGSIPAIAADLVILNVYNIYANSQLGTSDAREVWWNLMYNQLRTGQAMDPYFRDIYRLTEGLLAYEANKSKEAIALLSASEPFLNSSDPLLVAAFIAHQELHDNKLAFELANRASLQPDAGYLALGFAEELIKKRSGCKLAIKYLYSRIPMIPEQYRQGIIGRIQRLKASDTCKNEI